MIKVLIVASIIFGVVFSVGLAAENIPLAQMASGLQIFSQDLLDGLDLLGLNDPEQDVDAQPIISSSSVDFEFDVIKVDEDINDPRDDHFLNVVSACSFHSDESILGETCVVCTLLDSNKESVGTGKVTLADGYDSSTSIPVPINDVEFEGQNSVFSVKEVELKICDVGQGCNVQFWNNPIPPAWDDLPGIVETTTPFRTAFGILPGETFEITLINGTTVSHPTLLDALNADASLLGLNALVPQAVAALLNSQSAIDYNLTAEEVVVGFYGAFTNPGMYDPDTLAASLATINDLECPLPKAMNNGAQLP